ncbi:MAG TPA: PAS domain S-box protein, partial [Solirubrobacteraceae bacterium]
MDDSRRDLGWNDLSADEIARLCADNVISTLPERLFFKDLESHFVLVTSGWAKSFGAHQPAEEIRGKTDADFFSAEHAARARVEDQRVIRSGEWLEPRLMRLDQDGVSGWTRVSKGPLLDGNGNVVGVWGVTHDVTAEMEAEQEVRESRDELQASEAMHRALFEQSPHPTCIYDKGTLQVIAVNRAAVETYGYSRE